MDKELLTTFLKTGSVCSFITTHVNHMYISLKMKPTSQSGDQQREAPVSQEDPDLCTCSVGTRYELFLSEGFPSETAGIKLLLCDVHLDRQ